jgi:hypothetical protein
MEEITLIDVAIWIIPAFVCYFGYSCFRKYHSLYDLDDNFSLIEGFFHSIIWSCVFGWPGLGLVIMVISIYFIRKWVEVLYWKNYDRIVKRKTERIRKSQGSIGTY